MNELGDVTITPHAQLVLLQLLQDGARRSYGAAIARTLRFSTGTVTGILNRLHRAGWVSREVVEDPDGQFRRAYVQLTAEGADRARAVLDEGLTPTDNTFAIGLGLSVNVLDPPAPSEPNDLGWTNAFMRVLGDELRRERKARGWTRKELRDHIGEDISLQTLATYELGTRRITVIRLVDITLALGTTAIEVMARTHERVFDDPENATGWTIDLTAAAHLRYTDLAPLRRWAAGQLRAGGPPIVRLRRAAAEALAVLCGVALPDLVARLPRPHRSQPTTKDH